MVCLNNINWSALQCYFTPLGIGPVDIIIAIKASKKCKMPLVYLNNMSRISSVLLQ